MHRLTRQVRFGIASDGTLAEGGTNGFAARPPLLGLGLYLEFEATFAGTPDAASQYVKDIKLIDRAVRTYAVAAVQASLQTDRPDAGGRALLVAFEQLSGAFADVKLERLRLRLSPQLSMDTDGSTMIRLTQTFEFSASHRLHSPALSDEENRTIYGKCNNPQGHGHNYAVEVTLQGTPDAHGVLIDIPTFERVVDQVAIEHMDHKHLNSQVAEFAELIPSVENIAMVVFRRLKPHFSGTTTLANVRVYETPKTWCDYSE